MQVHTIRRQLALILLINLVTTVCLGTVGYWGLKTGHQSIDSILVSTIATRAQMQADMMHDALRGDVFAAILATTEEARSGARVDVQEHAKSLADSIAEVKSLPLGPAALDEIQSAEKMLLEYRTLAVELVDAGAVEPAKAQARLPEFLEKFE